VDAFSSYALPDLLHGFAGIDFLPSPGFLARLLDRAQYLAPAMSSEALARTSDALARLEVIPPHTWQEAWVHAVGQQLHGVTLEELRALLGALAQWGAKPDSSFMGAATARLSALLPVATPSLLVGVLWGFAQMGYKPSPATLHGVLAALRSKLRVLSVEELAALAWSLCSLRHRPGAQWLLEFQEEVAVKASFMDSQVSVCPPIQVIAGHWVCP